MSVADAPANAAGDETGAVLSLPCSPVNVFCCAVPFDKLAVACLSLVGGMGNEPLLCCGLVSCVVERTGCPT